MSVPWWLIAIQTAALQNWLAFLLFSKSTFSSAHKALIFPWWLLSEHGFLCWPLLSCSNCQSVLSLPYRRLVRHSWIIAWIWQVAYKGFVRRDLMLLPDGGDCPVVAAFELRGRLLFRMPWKVWYRGSGSTFGKLVPLIAASNIPILSYQKLDYYSTFGKWWTDY